MLKITVTVNEEALTIRLEGKLVAEWAVETERIWQQVEPAAEARRSVVDLHDVLAIDGKGRQLLGEMHAAGAELQASGLVNSAVIEEIGAEQKTRRDAVTKLLGLMFLWFFVVLGSPAFAQIKIAQEPAPYPNLRIVNPENVRRRPVLPLRIATAPLRWVGSKLESGLNVVEERNLEDRARIVLSNPNFRPVFGSLGDGSGFGGGAEFSTVGITSPHWGFIGGLHVTASQYVESSAGLRFKGSAGVIGDLTLDLTTGYRQRPEDDFWGAGADPGNVRTNFNLQERFTGVSIVARPSRRLSAGSELKYSTTFVLAGRDARLPSTQAVFGNSSLPGLMNGAELLETSIFAEYDTRNGVTSPAKAFYLAARMSSVDGLGSGNFGYWRYSVDQRLYVPLGSDRRVLAVRTHLFFTDRKGNSEVPFFRLARLGDTQTLRGYDSNRFYGRNAAAWNVEYRTDLTGGLGAFAFTDFGQVFQTRSEFNTRNFRHSYGGGLQIKGKKAIFLRAYVAKSEEQTRFIISVGPTF